MIIWVMICLMSSSPGNQAGEAEATCVPCLSLCLFMAQCLAHNRCSRNVCGTSEWMKEGTSGFIWSVAKPWNFLSCLAGVGQKILQWTSVTGLDRSLKVNENGSGQDCLSMTSVHMRSPKAKLGVAPLPLPSLGYLRVCPERAKWKILNFFVLIF